MPSNLMDPPPEWSRLETVLKGIQAVTGERERGIFETVRPPGAIEVFDMPDPDALSTGPRLSSVFSEAA